MKRLILPAILFLPVSACAVLTEDAQESGAFPRLLTQSQINALRSPLVEDGGVNENTFAAKVAPAPANGALTDEERARLLQFLNND